MKESEDKKYWNPYLAGSIKRSGAKQMTCLKKSIMKNIIVFTGLLIGFWGAAHAAEQRKITASELFNIKCTTCHGADESFKRHATKEQFLLMIRTMQFGAKVSDQEMERIAAFLGDPTRILFEQRCTRCHDINRIRGPPEEDWRSKNRCKVKGTRREDEKEGHIRHIRTRCCGDIPVFNFFLLIRGTGQNNNSANYPV